MRILLTNDDGINAPGLAVLEDIANALSDDVWVFAPEFDQSGAAHSLTLHEPLRMRQINGRKFAIRGTPTDSVIMGVRHILKDEPPALVLSGVNRGANMADDVTYSGTIAGAIEGTLLGIPSIALSLAINWDDPSLIHWDTPRELAPPLIRRLLDVGWSSDVLMNINFPHREPAAVAGVVIAEQGRRDQNAVHIDGRIDARGHPYYWVGFGKRLGSSLEGTDIAAIMAGSISVTPLHLNLTHFDTCNRLKDILLG